MWSKEYLHHLEGSKTLNHKFSVSLIYKTFAQNHMTSLANLIDARITHKKTMSNFRFALLQKILFTLQKYIVHTSQREKDIDACQ